MRTLFLLTCLAISGSGCRESYELLDGACEPSKVDAGSPIDMATPPPKCAAAEGLKGDNLLCVDFKDVQMLSSLTGWDFTCTGGTAWSTATGKLQVNAFSTFMSTCTATLPALSTADYQKYSRFQLAIVQTIDVNPAQQRIQIMLGADDPMSRLIAWLTGTQPRQHNLYSLAKAALPNGGTNTYQPLLKITSSVGPGGGYMGWQIESIAIQGIP